MTPPLDNPPKARRLHWALAAAVLVGLLGGGWYWLGGREKAPAPPDVALDGVDAPVRAAIEAARERVRRQPRSANAWGHLGKVLRAHGYHPQADVCFRQAEALDPEEPRWPYLLGAQLVLEDTAAALPLLERAVTLCERRGSDSRLPRLRLAEALVQLGRDKEAERHFRLALEQDPDDPRALYGVGVCAAGRNDRAVAIDCLSRAIDSPTTRKKALALLATVYLRSGRKKAAADFSRLAAKAPPDQPWVDAYINEWMDLEVGRRREFKVVEGLEARGLTAEARQALSRLARDYPDVRSLVSLAIRLGKTGQLEQAERALRRSIALNPDTVQGHYYLCVVLLARAEQARKGDALPGEQTLELFRQAAASGRRATELKPDHAAAHLSTGLALQHLNKRTEAIACFRRAVRCRPEQSDPHLYLGEALAQAGQREEALRELGLAVDLAPKDDPRPRAALARVRGAGNLPE